MPDRPHDGKHTHPVKELVRSPRSPAPRRGRGRRAYAELRCKTNFSFLRGASHPEELAERAAELGYAAFAVTDRNTLAGVVRAHCAAKSCGIKLIIGAELTPVDAPPITLYCPDRASYGRLARIITQGRVRTIKGSCEITLNDIAQWSDGLIASVYNPTVAMLSPIDTGGQAASGTQTPVDVSGRVIPGVRGRVRQSPDRKGGDQPHKPWNTSNPTAATGGGRYTQQVESTIRQASLALADKPPVAPDGRYSQFPTGVEEIQNGYDVYRDIFAGRLYVAAGVHGGVDDERQIADTYALAGAWGVPLIASNDVHYHEPQRRFLQDVLTCVREKCTLAEAGRRLFANAERHFKSVDEMYRLFASCPEAVARTVELAERCRFSLDELRYEYPEALCPPDQTPHGFLARLAWTGAKRRYPDGIPAKTRSLIEHELRLIRELSYEPYFLTVWDIVKFARSRNILCQGRGSAANSAVCYCLGITAVDPSRVDLLFERFVSAERNEPPDIDVDFEHERREEVFQYIYNKYGREHAGIVAEVITYRPRSAIRDVGKALGLSADRIGALAKKHEWWEKEAVRDDVLNEVGFDPADRSVRMLSRLVRQLVGFPRHLSQHVGGFVITRGPLCEMVPIENGAMPDRTFIEWDKDDIDALGILKIDCLALGMLTAIHKCFDFVNGSDEATERRSDEGRLRESDEGEGDRAGSLNERRSDEGKRPANLTVQERRGTPTRDIQPEKQTNGATSIKRRKHDECRDFSRSDCLAEGDGAGEDGVSGDVRHAGERAVRLDDADATGGGVDTVEHCRRTRARKPYGLSPFSTNGERLADGTPNTTHPDQRTPSHQRNGTIGKSTSRNGPCTTRSNQKPDEIARGEKKQTNDRRNAPKVKRDAPPLPSSPQPASAGRRSVAPSLRPSSHPSVRKKLTLHNISPEDPAVYHMICHADTVGVFQIESRAQMSMLPRLRPRCYYDLVIEVAIVRPGPIQGGMVHPYLRRRNGEEAVTYPNEAIKAVLEKTLGVPLFQEQAMRLAVVAAGFTPGEADQLRRSMGAWRRNGTIEAFRTKLISGMRARGLSEEFAERCFKQISGFGEYGFPESHAASFALLVYVSAWLKRYHPAAWCASMINSWPLGFYHPAQLVRDAREHGVQVLPIDVNCSGYDCRLEEEATERRRFRQPSREPERATKGREDPARWGTGGPVLRLGMRLIKGISQAQVEGIERGQRDRPFASVADLAHRSGAARATLAKLAAADALRSLGLDRRRALWQVLALREEPPMLKGTEPKEADPNLPELSLEEIVFADYESIGLSLNAHPMSLVRKELKAARIVQSGVLRNSAQGKWLRVAGLVLVRQRPSTALGIVFCTLEDETGTANLVIPPDIFAKYRRAAQGSVALMAEGKVERQGEVVHLKVRRMENLSDTLSGLRSTSRDFH